MKKIFSKLIPDEDFRKPTTFLNYKTKVDADAYRSMGPNTIGEKLWPVSISDDKLTIGLSYVGPPDNG